MSSAPSTSCAEPALLASRPEPGSREAGGLRAPLLQLVAGLLEANAIPYCILRGDGEWLAPGASRAHVVIPAEFLKGPFATLLRANQDRLGAFVVQWTQLESRVQRFVLVTKEVATRGEFLEVDVSSDYRWNARLFFRGEELLDARRPGPGFWVLAPALDFGHSLVDKVARRALTVGDGSQLTALYRKDPSGCDRQTARFWRGSSQHLIGCAGASGEWQAVLERLPRLRRELLWTVPNWGPATVYRTAHALRQVRRWQAPTGVLVALLGPDGAGKSTTLKALAPSLAPAFERVTASHLAPALFRGAGSNNPVTAPHNRAPRSLAGSLVKVAYWLIDYSVGYYAKIRPALSRSTLVLYDRYLVDTLVDPRRYRYAGPRWLLRLAWWLVPKPDLVILLDAPTEVLRARKEEVPLQETERQRHAYRELVAGLRNGHVIDASQPPDRVVRSVSSVVLDFLIARTARRLAADEPN